MKYGNQACRAFAIVVAAWGQIAFGGHAFAQESVGKEGQGENPMATEKTSIPLSKRPVSVAQSRISVQRLLEEVSEQVSVTLECDDTFKYSKLVVFVKDTPFGSLRSALANVLDAEWTTKKGEGTDRATVYRLAPTEHRRTVEQELREAQKEILAEQLRSRADAWAQGDIAQRHLGGDGGDRGRAYEEYKGRGQILSLIPQEAYQAALNGDSVEFPVGEMKGEFRKAVREFARRIAMPVSSGWEPNFVDKAVVVVESMPYSLRENPELRLSDLRFSFEIRGDRTSTYNITAESPAFREALFDRAVQLGAIPGKNGDNDDPRGGVSGRPLPGELTAWKVENVGIDQALEKVHRATGVAVLSDYYSRPPAPELNFQGDNLSALFDAIGEVFNRSWRHVQDCHVFRSRTWWLDEALELPEERVPEWREKYNKAKAWDEDTVVEMFALPEPMFVVMGPQIGRLIKLLPEVSIVAGSYPVLHLYATLTSEERAKARSEAGLSLSEVPAATKRVFSQASGANPMLVNNMGIKQTLPAGNLKVTVVGAPEPRIDFLFTPPAEQQDQAGHQQGTRPSARRVSVPLSPKPAAKPAGEK